MKVLIVQKEAFKEMTAKSRLSRFLVGIGI